MIATVLSVILFAIIGSVINAPAVYWVFFGLYVVAGIAYGTLHLGSHESINIDIEFLNKWIKKTRDSNDRILKNNDEILDVSQDLIKTIKEYIKETKK